MQQLFETLINHFTDFLSQGGMVLWVIFTVTVLLFVLISLRYLYLSRIVSKEIQRMLAAFSHPYNHYQRRFFLLHFHRDFFRGHELIKFMIAILPLLGLLGTVTGMISVFETMAYFGNSNPRLMAQGVAQAILPTMAGMAVAVLSLLAYHFLQLQVKKQQRLLQQRLSYKEDR